MNKTQRREKSAHQAMDVALKALERIEAHEKECGERWAEAVFELKYLREATDAHSARWEKLAWMVLGTFVATAVVHFVDLMV
jgi:Flp pilus assembly protein TadB